LLRASGESWERAEAGGGAAMSSGVGAAGGAEEVGGTGGARARRMAARRRAVGDMRERVPGDGGEGNKRIEEGWRNAGRRKAHGQDAHATE